MANYARVFIALNDYCLYFLGMYNPNFVKPRWLSCVLRSYRLERQNVSSDGFLVDSCCRNNFKKLTTFVDQNPHRGRPTNRFERSLESVYSKSEQIVLRRNICDVNFKLQRRQIRSFQTRDRNRNSSFTTRSDFNRPPHGFDVRVGSGFKI